VTQIVCGVDVSSTLLDARIEPNGAAGRFANTPDGIAELAEFCQAHGAALVVMEATGGYERQALYLLAERGLALSLANPRQVRRFAEAMGVLEKADRIDAGLIARAHRARSEVIDPQASERAREIDTLTESNA